LHPTKNASALEQALIKDPVVIGSSAASVFLTVCRPLPIFNQRGFRQYRFPGPGRMMHNSEA
jgi:hypothetical protein